MDRGAWWATVHGIAKELDMTEQLNNNNNIFNHNGTRIACVVIQVKLFISVVYQMTISFILSQCHTKV